MPRVPLSRKPRTVARMVVTVVLLTVTACAPVSEPRPTGVVSAASPEASEAGAEILALGGNAVDAAIAVQFALGVTEPAMSGLGGQTQMLIQRPGESAIALNGTSYSPRGTPIDATRDALMGRRASTIPATVRTLDYAWRTMGSGEVSWEQLLGPAIRYAEEGFVVGPFRHLVWVRHREDLAGDSAAAALFLRPDGTVPQPGSVFRQPVLARTLRRLAEEGGSAFYEGEMARQIAGDMAARGGWIELEDLAGTPEPRPVPAIATSFHDTEVATFPPPAGGWVVLQALNLMELQDSPNWRADGDAHARGVAEALRIAHRSRATDPVEDLVDYAEGVSDRISKETARQRWRARDQGAVQGAAQQDRPNDAGRGETTHFTVVDGDGLMVAATASVNGYFGARAAHPELGFLYNDYMREFVVGEPDHPFALRPGAMPYSSMSPTIVSRDGEPVLGLGSPGSARIPSAVAQVIDRWVTLGQPIGDAVAAPRLHVVPEALLYVEGAPEQPAPLWVADLGFEYVVPSFHLSVAELNPYFGGVHAVAWEQGGWRGAADPRRDGAVR